MWAGQYDVLPLPDGGTWGDLQNKESKKTAMKNPHSQPIPVHSQITQNTGKKVKHSEGSGMETDQAEKWDTF